MIGFVTWPQLIAMKKVAAVTWPQLIAMKKVAANNNWENMLSFKELQIFVKVTSWPQLISRLSLQCCF